MGKNTSLDTAAYLVLELDSPSNFQIRMGSSEFSVPLLSRGEERGLCVVLGVHMASHVLGLTLTNSHLLS